MRLSASGSRKTRRVNDAWMRDTRGKTSQGAAGGEEREIETPLRSGACQMVFHVYRNASFTVAQCRLSPVSTVRLPSKRLRRFSITSWFRSSARFRSPIFNRIVARLPRVALSPATTLGRSASFVSANHPRRAERLPLVRVSAPERASDRAARRAIVRKLSDEFINYFIIRAIRHAY